MDSYHEQKAIEKQNKEWKTRKTKRKNNLEKDHAWLRSDKRTKEKSEKIWYNLITPENQFIIDKNS